MLLRVEGRALGNGERRDWTADAKTDGWTLKCLSVGDDLVPSRAT